MKKIFIVLGSIFLLNNCSINQESFFDLGCKSPQEISDAPIDELLNAKNESVIINNIKRSYLGTYEYIWGTIGSCYNIKYDKNIDLVAPQGYKDIYWLIYKSDTQNIKYRYIKIEPYKKENNTFFIKMPRSISEWPTFIVIERSINNNKKYYKAFIYSENIY
ncbi:MAG: hypothetical protein U0457_01565 [Candidatus Sericytochromatia bacterium]